MSENKQFLTHEGRVSFPSLFKPKLNDLSGNHEWSVTLLFPKDGEAVKQLKNAVLIAAKEKFGDKIPAKFKNPIKNGDECFEKDGVTIKNGYAGHNYVQFKSVLETKNGQRSAPIVVDENREAIIDQSGLYGGCYGQVSTQAYGYDNIAKGVSLQLLGFMKTRDGEPFGAPKPSINDMFGEAESSSAGAENPDNYKKAPAKAVSNSFDDLLN